MESSRTGEVCRLSVSSPSLGSQPTGLETQTGGVCAPPDWNGVDINLSGRRDALEEPVDGLGQAVVC